MDAGSVCKCDSLFGLFMRDSFMVYESCWCWQMMVIGVIFLGGGGWWWWWLLGLFLAIAPVPAL